MIFFQKLFVNQNQQHASLQIAEIYNIQFDVFCRNNEFSSRQVIFRFRWYMYFTFEFQLFCIFSIVIVEINDLIRRSFSKKLTEKFKLICRFCADFNIKEFANITEFWAHFVHQHQIIDNQKRLSEIQRTILLWKTYWNLYNSEEKKENSTLIKLNQILQSGFTWHQMLEWSFRYY